MQRLPIFVVCALSGCLDLDAEPQTETVTGEVGGGDPLCEVLDAKAWRPPVRIGVDTNRSFTYPAVAASTNGTVVAAWLLQDTQVMINRYARTGLFTRQWSDRPTSLASFVNAGRYAVAPPAVAIDDTGRAVVVWMETPSLDSYVIKARRFDPASNTWSPTSTLGTSQFQVPTAPSVAMDGAGNAIAVWENQTAPEAADIMYAQLPAAAVSWTAAAILDTSAGAARRPRVATTPGGDVVAVWTQRAPAELRVLARARRGGAWTAATIIDATTDAIDAVEVQLDVGATGNIVVTWLANEQLWAASGTTATWLFGAPQLVNTPPAGVRSLPGMPAIDAAGNAVIAWSHLNGPGYARRMTNNVVDPTVTTLSIANHPHVDVDDAGNALVVSTAAGSVRANRLVHRPARPLCPETWTWRTNPPIALEAMPTTSAYANITMFRNGNAVAVWRELGEPSSGDAVYAALYN